LNQFVENQHAGNPARQPRAADHRSDIASPHDSLYARATGLFDRTIRAGQDVRAGDAAGWFHHIGEPERVSERLFFAHDGMILAHTNRGVVTRGELLALVVRDVVVA